MLSFTLKDNFIVIAMSHCYKCDNGDIIPDPNTVIRLFPESKTAEAIEYQDHFSCELAYTDNFTKVIPKIKIRLNSF